jgi:uncharacterized protein (DUF736 family)
MSKEQNNTQGELPPLTEVGSFWKQTRGGSTFLKGSVKLGDREFKAFIFPNKKTKDTHPDFRLSISDLDEDLMPPKWDKSTSKNTSDNNDDFFGASESKPSGGKPSGQKAQRQAPQQSDDSGDDADIPF